MNAFTWGINVSLTLRQHTSLLSLLFDHVGALQSGRPPSRCRMQFPVSCIAHPPLNSWRYFLLMTRNFSNTCKWCFSFISLFWARRSAAWGLQQGHLHVLLQLTLRVPRLHHSCQLFSKDKHQDNDVFPISLMLWWSAFEGRACRFYLIRKRCFPKNASPPPVGCNTF